VLAWAKVTSIEVFQLQHFQASDANGQEMQRVVIRAVDLETCTARLARMNLSILKIDSGVKAVRRSDVMLWQQGPLIHHILLDLMPRNVS
jgi:hypothetical protein